MSGITITTDTGTEFESGAAEYCSVARLDDTHFIIAYRDGDDANAGKVVVGTISGTSINMSSGDIAEFESGEAIYISITALSSSKFVISYVDDTDGDKCKAIVGTVSGTTITLGTIQEVSANDCGYTSISNFPGDATDSYFIVAYADTTNGDCSCKFCTVSGTVITFGAEYDSNTAITSTTPVGVAGSPSTSYTKFAIICENSVSAVRVRIGTVTPATKAIAFGTDLTLVATAEVEDGMPNIAFFDDTHFIMSVLDGTTFYFPAIFDESTNVITAGAGLGIGQNAGPATVCVIDSTHFIASYRPWPGTEGYVRPGTLSGSTTLAWDEAASEFDSGNTSYYTICNMDNEHFLVGFLETP